MGGWVEAIQWSSRGALGYDEENEYSTIVAARWLRVLGLAVWPLKMSIGGFYGI